MKDRVKWCAALTTAFLCMASPARADKEAIALDYQPGAGCPDRAKFVERVQAITSKADIVGDDGGPRRKFGIHVSRVASAVNGELTIDDHGVRTTRTVSGASCDEVISALALATALAVDPEALGGEATPPAAPAPTPPPAPAPVPVPAAPKPPKPPSVLSTPPSKPEPHRPLLELSVGAREGDTLAPFPKLEGIAELGTTYWAPFEIHLGGAYGPKEHNHQTQFSDWTGSLGMGYRMFDLEPFSVWADLGLELGQVHGSGRNITPAFSVDRTWAAVDVGVRGRVDGPGPLFFQANVGGRAPLLLQRYVVQENTGKFRELHQVQQLGYLLGLSVGMHFL